MAGRKRRTKLKPNLNKNELETWSDLPKDLLLSILSRLTLKESTCASAVCKSWFSVVISERVFSKSPLLLRIPKSGYVFELYNPTTRKTSYTELPQLRDCLIFNNSVDGWLLASRPSSRRVFVFNPHTQVSIGLPSFNLRGHKAVLTSSPVSNDGMVFALKNTSLTRVAISTCNLRTMKWTTNDYPSPEPEIIENSLLIFSNGLLYFQSTSGWLWSFDTRTCEWTLNVVPLNVGENMWCWYIAKHREHLYIINTCVKPIIYRLDQTNGKWEEIKNLGGLIFFVDSQLAEARVHIMGMKANNIYYPEVRFYGQQCIRYSVDEGRYYPTKKYSFPQEKHLLESIWIDQPASLL